LYYWKKRVTYSGKFVENRVKLDVKGNKRGVFVENIVEKVNNALKNAKYTFRINKRA